VGRSQLDVVRRMAVWEISGLGHQTGTPVLLLTVLAGSALVERISEEALAAWWEYPPWAELVKSIAAGIGGSAGSSQARAQVVEDIVHIMGSAGWSCSVASEVTAALTTLGAAGFGLGSLCLVPPPPPGGANGR
jgi:hypothetical protein